MSTPIPTFDSGVTPGFVAPLPNVRAWKRAPSDPALFDRDEDARAAELDRRESALNARLAAFEAAARNYANADLARRSTARRDEDERVKQLSSALDLREKELDRKLSEIEDRERKLADPGSDHP